MKTARGCGSSTKSWRAAAASVPPCCRRRKVWRWASRSADGPVRLDHLVGPGLAPRAQALAQLGSLAGEDGDGDRKSTRLNSSHLVISYAVFCLQKKNPADHR